MKHFGLIGKKLSHSFSKSYFTDKFHTLNIEATYENYEIPSIHLISAIIREDALLEGFNVTIPYKEEIIPLLDHISPEAQAIGAVNCVKIDRSNPSTPTTFGYNTDAIGFEISLLRFLATSRPHHAYILGTGGAAKAVAYVLDKLGISYTGVSRTPNGKTQIDYSSLQEKDIANTLIVNTTPLGMFPNIDTYPDINYARLDASSFLYDLTYNPPLTRFLELGLQQNAHIINGKNMLELQAEAGWHIWNK